MKQKRNRPIALRDNHQDLLGIKINNNKSNLHTYKCKPHTTHRTDNTPRRGILLTFTLRTNPNSPNPERQNLKCPRESPGGAEHLEILELAGRPRLLLNLAPYFVPFF
jgi:hypothetical protein